MLIGGETILLIVLLFISLAVLIASFSGMIEWLIDFFKDRHGNSKTPPD